VTLRQGGCQCGRVRFAAAGEPLALYICHCRECRKQSASAFGMSLQMPRAGLTVTAGTPRTWTRDADSGRRVECVFCPDCGSRLWHQGNQDTETVTIKAGVLDDPPNAASAIHIWVSRKLPGIAIPDGAQRFDEEPD
jgi:hypothetical protein